MKSYLILIPLLLTACNSPKPSHFLCITALGPAKFDSDQEKVKIGRVSIKLDQDTQTVTIPRELCVEFQEK